MPSSIINSLACCFYLPSFSPFPYVLIEDALLFLSEDHLLFDLNTHLHPPSGTLDASHSSVCIIQYLPRHRLALTEPILPPLCSFMEKSETKQNSFSPDFISKVISFGRSLLSSLIRSNASTLQIMTFFILAPVYVETIHLFLRLFVNNLFPH